jgi:hypothetical protein
MEVICLEDEALESLVKKLVNKLGYLKSADKSPWVGQEEAMYLLGVSSKTTLQKYRDENRIIFTKPQPKIILYKRDSILKYLDEKSNQ